MTGPHRSRVARAAGTLVALTGLSQLLGLLRDMVIAAVFGARAALDAYLYAQGVMNLVLALFAAGMVKAMVPPLARLADAGDTAGARRTFQTLVSLAMAVTLAGALVAGVLAGPIVAALAPGFDAQTAAVAVRLTRVLLVAGVFVALTDLCAAAAQAHGRFALSGLQGVPFNLVMIVAAAGFGTAFGVEALAVGFVVGSAARFALQLPSLRGTGLPLRPRWSVRDPGVAAALVLLPPLLLTAVTTNVNTLVDRAVGSSQGVGVITALSFGWRIVMVVDALLVVTVAAALYPAFSRADAGERRGELRRLLGGALRVMTVGLAPVVVLLVLAAEPIVRVVYGRGAFDAAAAQLTSTAVAWYAGSALALAWRVIMTRALLAVGVGRTTVVSALISMVVNVAGDLTLGVRYGVAGLAASTTASLLVGAAWLAVSLGRRHRALPGRELAGSAGRVLLAVGASVALAGLAALDRRLPWTGPAADLAVVGLTGLLVGAGYLGTLLLLRAREPAELVALLPRRR